MSLTRYDGWFLIPFASLGFALFAKQSALADTDCIWDIASLAPLYWLAHNWWETGHALDFYNGPYSPLRYKVQSRIPGITIGSCAFLYYSAAAQLCAGWPLLLLGCIGVGCAAVKKVSHSVVVSAVDADILCLEHSLFRGHANSCPAALAVHLLQHSLWNRRRAIGRVCSGRHRLGATSCD